MMKRLLIGAAVFAAVWVVFRLLETQEVDVPKVEQEIETWAQTDLDARGDVEADCPESIEWQTGSDFHCILSDRTGSVRVTVTMENDEGEMTLVVG